MDGKEESKRVLELGRQALQTNREHLNALQAYAQRLEAELEELDKLIEAVDSDTVDEPDLDIGSSVTIPGSVRATAPVAVKELLLPEFPFREDALKRSRYQSFSEVHPMKPKELETLAEAVRAESYRKHALDIQKMGLTAFSNIDVHAIGLDAEGIDWARVAEKVSTTSATTRTARECEIRWLGEQHPEVNHEPWSKEEVAKVKSHVAEFTDGRPDWVAVAKRLGTRRTPLDCMRHAIPRKVHQWTKDADKRLLEAIRMYGHDNWHLVARQVSEDATPSQCSSRFEKTLDESVKHMAWSPEEDARLSTAVAAYGSSWIDVAASIPGRHNDQCRDRWTEQTNPSINKSQWSEDEDRFLVDYMREHKNPTWKEISERLHTGRTEAMCRNRYAVLQKGANTIRAKSAIDHGTASADYTSLAPSSNTFRFKSSFPAVNSSPATLVHTKIPSQVVFLEPVVGSNPESHKYHKPQSRQHPTRSDPPSPNTTSMPLSKRRKTRQHIAKPKKLTKAQQDLPS